MKNFENDGYIGTKEMPIDLDEVYDSSNIENGEIKLEANKLFKKTVIKEFKMLNVITGLNGVGKTYLLQSINSYIVNNSNNKYDSKNIPKFATPNQEKINENRMKIECNVFLNET